MINLSCNMPHDHPYYESVNYHSKLTSCLAYCGTCRVTIHTMKALAVTVITGKVKEDI